MDSTFAGYVVEGEFLVVHTTDPGRAAALTRIVDEQPELFGGNATSGSARRPVTTRTVEYSYLTLHEWRRRISDQVWGPSDVVALDLDEYHNRLSVTLEAGVGEAEVRDIFAANDVPQEALRIEIGGRPSFLQTLDDAASPVRAGFRVQVKGKGGCTLGFNAKIGGTNLLVTASHCTTAMFSDSNDSIFQPASTGLSPRYVGIEWLDPPTFSTSFCQFWFGVQNCRFSDAAAFAYSLPADSIGHGRIARTEWVGSGSAGSLTINASNPFITIASELDEPATGTFVYKMGQTTGWTGGHVGDTCENHEFTNGVVIMCSTEANVYALPGDSGSPIFSMPWGGWQTANASLGGVLIGALLDELGQYVGPAVFSTLGRVEEELGDMAVVYVPPPPPVTATIPPPYNVPPGGLCQWSAGATGGTAPYSYLWRKNGVNVGTSSTYTYEVSSGNFLLELRVTDSSQAIDWDSRSIVVQNGSNGCPV